MCSYSNLRFTGKGVQVFRVSKRKDVKGSTDFRVSLLPTVKKQQLNSEGKEGTSFYRHFDSSLRSCFPCNFYKYLSWQTLKLLKIQATIRYNVIQLPTGFKRDNERRVRGVESEGADVEFDVDDKSVDDIDEDV